MKYKAVIFDLDGTLIDSMGVWKDVDKEFLEKRNIPVPENLFEDIDGGNSFNEVCLYFKQKFDLTESIEEIGAEWTEMVAGHYENSVKLKPGVVEFLELLGKNNVKMGVGTSNNKFLAETVLKANGVLEKFDSIVAGCEDIKGKPFPDIFLSVASELEVMPADCLVIEDVLVGVQAAKTAGMDVFAIYDKHSQKEKPAMEEIADFYADSYNRVISKLALD